MKQNQTFKRVYVVGDSYVGKSTLVYRLLNGIVDVDLSVTKPDELKSVFTVIESSEVQYEIIDIKGNDLYFMYNCSEIAKSADLVLMVYDVSNIDSLKVCMSRVDVMSEVLTSFKPIIFVGNKHDQMDQNQNQIEALLKQVVNRKYTNYEIIHSIFVSSLEGRNLANLHEVIMKSLGFEDKSEYFFVCNN